MKKIIRYIGSKEKLLGFLDETIFSKYKNDKINFLDGFTGTSVVSKHCQENYDWNLFLSDISDYSDIISSRLFISLCSPTVFKHLKQLQKLNGAQSIIFNEFSINGTPKTIDKESFSTQTVNSRMFFTEEVGQKIDAMRNYIQELFQNGDINEQDKKLMLMFVIAFADKNANTTSVYGAYLKKQDRPTIYIPDSFIDLLENEFSSNPVAPKGFYKGDIITNLKEMPELDVAYFDPPYNTRKYESNYHILNYISNLDFSIEDIKQGTKTGLPSAKTVNLFGSKKGTRLIFKDLILTGIDVSKNVFISYSSDGEMSKEEIFDICSDNLLDIDIYTKDYKKFKAKDIDTEKSLDEIIYHIRRR